MSGAVLLPLSTMAVTDKIYFGFPPVISLKALGFPNNLIIEFCLLFKGDNYGVIL
jgi:hypothetical protein